MRNAPIPIIFEVPQPSSQLMGFARLNPSYKDSSSDMKQARRGSTEYVIFDFRV
jgi:hypothetical protein